MLELLSGKDCLMKLTVKVARFRNCSSTSRWSDFFIACPDLPTGDRFILKGALLLTAWHAPQSRPTVDIDLEGQTSNEPGHIQTAIQEICATVVPADGIHFDPATVKVARIKEDAEYEGVRARFRATLSRAQIEMQIDIGFGDIVVPKATPIEYPSY